jgi:uncharacterized protein YcbK (DUF882 family)
MRYSLNDFVISKHYNLKEFECPCCNTVKIATDLVEALENLSDLLREKLQITSGYRCPKHNKEVGGVPNSFHTQGLAVDIVRPKKSDGEIIDLARKAGFRGVGIYRGRGIVHLDLGPIRNWEE